MRVGQVRHSFQAKETEDWFAVEVILEEGDSSDDAWKLAIDTAIRGWQIKWGSTQIPTMIGPEQIHREIQVEKINPEQVKLDLLKGIMACTELDGPHGLTSFAKAIDRESALDPDGTKNIRKAFSMMYQKLSK